MIYDWCKPQWSQLMALAERMMNARFGDDLVDHRTYVIAGDGDLMEGVSHEACSLAGHLGLSRLIVLFDDNRITIDGATDLATGIDMAERFRAYDWDVVELGDAACGQHRSQLQLLAGVGGHGVFVFS